MSMRHTRENCPDSPSGANAGQIVRAFHARLRAVLKVATVPVALILSVLAEKAQGAEVVPYCEADKYKACPSFLTSVTIGDHVEIIDNALAGFTRSEGSWTIDVRYEPAGSCAIVKMLLNKGPIDSLRSYRRTFTGGGGQVRDSGRFMHKTDHPESSLKVVHSSCYVPAEAPLREAGQPSDSGASGQPDELDDVLERLARGDLDSQLERLASEEQRIKQAARERRRLEQERERQQRLAGQQRERERQRELIARQQRQQELDRLIARQRMELERQRREENEQAATDTMMTGLSLGLIGGVLGILADEAGDDYRPSTDPMEIETDCSGSGYYLNPICPGYSLSPGLNRRGAMQ